MVSAAAIAPTHARTLAHAAESGGGLRIRAGWSRPVGSRINSGVEGRFISTGGAGQMVRIQSRFGRTMGGLLGEQIETYFRPTVWRNDEEAPHGGSDPGGGEAGERGLG